MFRAECGLYSSFSKRSLDSVSLTRPITRYVVYLPKFGLCYKNPQLTIVLSKDCWVELRFYSMFKINKNDKNG